MNGRRQNCRLGCSETGLAARVLHVHLEVVLQVLAHRGQMVHDGRYRGCCELGRVAHAAELEELRCVERAAAQHHLVALSRLHLAAHGVLHAGGAGAVEVDAMDESAGDDLQVGALHHRVQVGARRAEASAAVHVAVEAGEALLLVAVDVAGERVAGLLAGFEEGLDERVLRRAALEHEGAAAATPLVDAGQAVLHLLEVGQAVGVVPGLHALVGGPALVVERVAALEDHPVDAAAAAQHLAAGVVHPAAVHERLGLALVLPVVEAAADREHQRGGHVDEDVPLVVGTAGLEHEHPVGRVGAEPVGQGRPCRPAADDDVVVTLHDGPSLLSRCGCGPRTSATSLPSSMRPLSTGAGGTAMPARTRAARPPRAHAAAISLLPPS